MVEKHADVRGSAMAGRYESQFFDPLFLRCASAETFWGFLHQLSWLRANGFFKDYRLRISRQPLPSFRIVMERSRTKMVVTVVQVFGAEACPSFFHDLARSLVTESVSSREVKIDLLKTCEGLLPAVLDSVLNGEDVNLMEKFLARENGRLSQLESKARESLMDFKLLRSGSEKTLSVILRILGVQEVLSWPGIGQCVLMWSRKKYHNFIVEFFSMMGERKDEREHKAGGYFGSGLFSVLRMCRMGGVGMLAPFLRFFRLEGKLSFLQLYRIRGFLTASTLDKAFFSGGCSHFPRNGYRNNSQRTKRHSYWPYAKILDFAPKKKRKSRTAHAIEFARRDLLFLFGLIPDDMKTEYKWTFEKLETDFSSHDISNPRRKLEERLRKVDKPYGRCYAEYLHHSKRILPYGAVYSLLAENGMEDVRVFGSSVSAEEMDEHFSFAILQFLTEQFCEKQDRCYRHKDLPVTLLFSGRSFPACVFLSGTLWTDVADMLRIVGVKKALRVEIRVAELDVQYEEDECVLRLSIELRRDDRGRVNGYFFPSLVHVGKPLSFPFLNYVSHSQWKEIE